MPGRRGSGAPAQGVPPAAPATPVLPSRRPISAFARVPNKFANLNELAAAAATVNALDAAGTGRRGGDGIGVGGGVAVPRQMMKDALALLLGHTWMRTDRQPGIAPAPAPLGGQAPMVGPPPGNAPAPTQGGQVQSIGTAASRVPLELCTALANIVSAYLSHATSELQLESARNWSLNAALACAQAEWADMQLHETLWKKRAMDTGWKLEAASANGHTLRSGLAAEVAKCESLRGELAAEVAKCESLRSKLAAAEAATRAQAAAEDGRVAENQSRRSELEAAAEAARGQAAALVAANQLMRSELAAAAAAAATRAQAAAAAATRAHAAAEAATQAQAAAAAATRAQAVAEAATRAQAAVAEEDRGAAKEECESMRSEIEGRVAENQSLRSELEAAAEAARAQAAAEEGLVAANQSLCSELETAAEAARAQAAAEEGRVAANQSLRSELAAARAAAAEAATQGQAAVEAATRAKAVAENGWRDAWEACRSLRSEMVALLTKTPEDAARDARIADGKTARAERLRSDVAAARAAAPTAGAEAATRAQAAVAEKDLGAARARVRTKRVGAEDTIAEKHGTPGDSGRTGTDAQAASDGEARLGDGGHRRKRLWTSPGQVCLSPPHPWAPFNSPTDDRSLQGVTSGIHRSVSTLRHAHSADDIRMASDEDDEAGDEDDEAGGEAEGDDEGPSGSEDDERKEGNEEAPSGGEDNEGTESTDNGPSGEYDDESKEGNEEGPSGGEDGEGSEETNKGPSGSEDDEGSNEGNEEGPSGEDEEGNEEGNEGIDNGPSGGEDDEEGNEEGKEGNEEGPIGSEDDDESKEGNKEGPSGGEDEEGIKEEENFHQMCNLLFLGAESAFLCILQFVISLFLRVQSPEGTLEVRCACRWSDLGADDQPGDILWVQRLELLEV